MKIFAIVDNHDTLMGLRLAGIEGVIVQNGEDTAAALEKAVGDGDIGMIFMTAAAAAMAQDTVHAIRLQKSQPLIVEIPDRHVKPGDINEALSQYVKQAIGAKL